MHQDYLSSAVYSSLIRPLPVVYKEGDESFRCGTNRKSKNPGYAAVEPIVDEGDCLSAVPGPNGSDEEEEAMDYRESSESQLRQISRGAHKLTRMIESWSKAPNLDGQSNYIADDLLRGALDLQESLIMLRRLQEASKVMAQRKRKQKLDLVEGRKEEEEEFDVESVDSRRFEIGGGCHTRLQEPRLSVDGASKNSVEDLKKVIRDSLHLQNLLPNTLDDEKASSSRSFNFSASNRFGDLRYERKEAVSSIATTLQPKKVKAPNLIAKLMGLEEVPSESVEPIRKEQEKKWCFTSPRANFDIETVQATKVQLIDQNQDRKQKTLQDIIETMQFKGLLKRSQVEDPRIRLRLSNTAQLARYDTHLLQDDEAPPIVIMKPLHLPCWERGDFQRDLLFGKASGKEETQSIQEKRVSDHEWMSPKTSERKEVKRMEKSKVESFEMANTRATVCQNQYRKEAIGTCKKPDGEPKPPLKGKKHEDKKAVKDVRAPISPDKTTSAAAAKPDKRSLVAKKYIPRDRDLNFPVKPASRTFTASSKEKKISGAKSVRRSTPTKAVNNKKLEDGNANNYLHSNGVVPSSTLPTSTLPKHAVQEIIPCNEDEISKAPKIIFEVMPKMNRSGKRPESAEEIVQLPGNTPTVTKSAGIEDDIKRLLLSSKSFLGLARELFGLDACRPICYRGKGLDEVVTRYAKLFLDCGKELLARKSHQLKLSIHLMWPCHVWDLWDQTVYTSLDQLVEEVSGGIEKLSSFVVVDGNATPKGGLYIRLERDLRCEEMAISVMWDIGWRNWVCVEESDQVIGEVEEQILSVLIAEIVMDLVC